MPNLEQAMPVISTFGEIASIESCWFAVQTMPRHEKKVSAELEAKQIQSFLPAISELRQWSDRKRMIESPLFPGYVFVRIAAQSSARIAVLRTNGVVGFVGVRGAGTPIPECEITAIQAVLTQQVPFRAHPFLNIGQRVRIRGGALDGIEGILDAVKGDQSLVISVELIQRSLAVRIAGYHVEPIHERYSSSSPALQSAGRSI
jgi:transcription antitermination factor NusG